MKIRSKARTATLLVTVFMIGALIGGPAVGQLGGLLKGAAVAVLVDKFAPQLDDAVNKLTGNNKVATTQETKVVPILSIGRGAFLGAAQVLGPRAAVKKVQAVGQLETGFGSFRIKALFPMSTKSAKRLDRIEGVGVSAIIDVKL